MKNPCDVIGLPYEMLDDVKTPVTSICERVLRFRKIERLRLRQSQPLITDKYRTN
jgi:hypothetical protein